MNPNDLLALGAFLHAAGNAGGGDGSGMGFNPAAALLSLFGGPKHHAAPPPSYGSGPSHMTMHHPQTYQPPQLPAGYPQMPQGYPPQLIGSQLDAYRALLSTPPGGAGSRFPGVRETLIGAGSFEFAAAGATATTFTFTPYKRFKPTRVIQNQAITGAPGQLVTITSANISDRNQLGGGGSIDVAAAFPANATFANINWDVIDPATPLVINLALTGALAAMTAIVQSLTVYGINLN